ncbi:hypothetical protein Y032_0332g2741 [Ancylostoma ceylanicum]|uniref:Uncharacterized protein n=1 Tax=Ancylostoma ceylanicum TaxID=53326 RepID=A0A016RZ25_9BILA|nr:hypothetical protein Y032_0332g2741 [Ancylostoma ceylanicum]
MVQERIKCYIIHTSLAVRLTPDFQTSTNARFARILHIECKENPENLSRNTYIPLRQFQRSPEIPSNPPGLLSSRQSDALWSGCEHLVVTDSVQMIA